jgi:hypothetical protein
MLPSFSKGLSHWRSRGTRDGTCIQIGLFVGGG